MNETLLIIAIVAVLGIVFFVYLKYQKKFPKFGSVSVVTGAVKSGKTSFVVYCAIRSWKKSHRLWKIRAFLARLTGKPVPEEPLLYSNIPLTVPHVRLTTDLLTRSMRFNYKSTLLLSEASLVADSQMIRDKSLNDSLLVFWKLFAHETRGGSAWLDTQSMLDNHYAVKRVAATTCYIQRTVKWLPFFMIMHVLEQRYSEDGTVIQVDTDDIDNRTKTLLIPKSVWKKFDCYTYSVLTDNLDPDTTIIRNCHDLKTRDILSFDPQRILACQNVGKRPERRAPSNTVNIAPAPAVRPVESHSIGAQGPSASCSLPTADRPLDGKEKEQ